MSNLKQTNSGGQQLYVMPIFDQIREQRKCHNSSSPRITYTNASECSVLSAKYLYQTGESGHLLALEVRNINQVNKMIRRVQIIVVIDPIGVTT